MTNIFKKFRSDQSTNSWTNTSIIDLILEKAINQTRLLVLNYSMNPNNPIFAHQIELILRLSEFFSEITVITADYHGEKLPKNVRVEKYDWVQGNPLRSTFNFYSKFLKLMTNSNFDLVFSHMVEMCIRDSTSITC